MNRGLSNSRWRRHVVAVAGGLLLAAAGGAQAVEAACGGSGEEPCSCTLPEVILEGCEACRGSRFKIPFVNECTGWPPGWYRLSVTLDDGRRYTMDIALR